MKKRLGKIAGILAILLAMGITVCAADASDITKNRVFQTISDVNLYEMPNTDSAVTAFLPYGTPVIVQEDAEDGWCIVSYREETGYVQIAFLGIIGSPAMPGAADGQKAEEGMIQDQTGSGMETGPEAGITAGSATGPDQENMAGGIQSGDAKDVSPADRNAGTLDDEFQRVRTANLLGYQEAEAAKKQEAARRMWGIAIAVLVIAIFAIGITTTLAGNKRKKDQE